MRKIETAKVGEDLYEIVKKLPIQKFTQEVTGEYAEALKKYAKTDNIAVVVKAEHHCMTMRGVREHESDMTTAIMLGAFDTHPPLKQEFYDICLSMKGHK